MTLSESATHIPCQRCGSMWLKADENSAHYFESASYGIGEYVSPAMISGEGEEMTNCPSCPIEAIDDSMTYPEGRIDDMDARRVDPDGHDSEQASQGDADVVHRGSLEE